MQRDGCLQVMKGCRLYDRHSGNILSPHSRPEDNATLQEALIGIGVARRLLYNNSENQLSILTWFSSIGREEQGSATVMLSGIISAIMDLDFLRLNEILANIDMLEVLQDPYFIGFMVVCCLIFIIRGMEKALVMFLSAPAFLVLFQYTIEGTDALDFDARQLLIFCGGFIAIAAVNIYVFFVRHK